MTGLWGLFHLEEENYRVDLTPLIDTMLVLLIFFMLISTFITTTSIDIKLPLAKNSSKEETNETRVIIMVNEKGDIFIDGIHVDFSHLEEWINKLPHDAWLEFKVDKNAPFNSFIKIIDHAKLRGLNKFKIYAIKENDS